MKRRVVVTGVGVISSLGHNYSEVVGKLKIGCSGIEKVEEWTQFGLESCVAGTIGDLSSKQENSGISKKTLTYASKSAMYCTLAAKDAVDDAQLEETDFMSSKTGCIVGSGVSDLFSIYQCADKILNQQIKRASPYTVCQSMSSCCSALIANTLSIKGRSYSISSACATSAHNIGHAYDLIREGALDIAITGGGEEISHLMTGAFCAMRMALSTRYNAIPKQASRPYDNDRDGFVISGGGGIVILEDLERAESRNAKIYGEIIGYWANSDGYSMILPDPKGYQTAECILKALEVGNVRPEDVDYINTHATSTPDGDLAEVNALRRAFGKHIPPFSSTKSMSGHALGAAGVNELIFCLGMVENQFIAPSINIENIDPRFEGLPVVQTPVSTPLNILMSNSFGFGGTNAVIVVRRYNG